MSLLSFIPSGAWAVRSRRADLERSPKPFQNQLARAGAASFLVLFFLAAALPQAALSATGTWSKTGPLAMHRSRHTATLLPNGKVLVTGGIGNRKFLKSAEIYDPATGTWSKTGALTTTRWAHTATLLPDGKVLVVGGNSSNCAWLVMTDSPKNSYLASAELYDPATGTWSQTGSMATPRYGHTATLLPNGKVLVAGGRRDTYETSAELYDPATGRWSPTASMLTAHYYHTATLLANGKALVLGPDSAEIYDPATGSWTATRFPAGEYVVTATLLRTGKVLVTMKKRNTREIGAELYDPEAGTWSPTGSPLETFRSDHTATLLLNGKVLVTGDYNSAELYDPATGTWSYTGPLITDILDGGNRYAHTATLLTDGRVLMAGGQPTMIDIMMASAQLYNPELLPKDDQKVKSK